MSVCTTIAVEDLTSHGDNYQSRKLAGVCVRKGCERAAGDDSALCPKHHEDQKRRHREYMERRHDKWDAAGKCTRCGRDRKPKSRWCAACLIEVGKVHHADLKSYGDNHSDRIAARLIPWENSPKNAGRVRLRGGKRGRVSKEQDNATDLRDLFRYLQKLDEGVTFAGSAEVQAMSPMSRKDALDAAMSWGSLLIRTGFELLKRNRYPVPDAREADHLDDDEMGGDDD